MQKFQGPIEKLLELIEARQLDINEISLAEVTDDFLKYLQALTDTEKTLTNAENKTPSIGVIPRDVSESLRLVADFIVIASRLIFIKSKSLLPDLNLTPEEEADIKDLEKRLKFYREFKPAMKIIDKLWKSGSREFGRPYFMGLTDNLNVFYPGRNLDAKSLTASLAQILEGLQKVVMENQTIKENIISIEEKIKEVIGGLKELGETTLSGLSGDKSRSEIIVIFLAVLHLAWEQKIFLEQKSHFSDIMIRSK